MLFSKDHGTPAKKTITWRHLTRDYDFKALGRDINLVREVHVEIYKHDVKNTSQNDYLCRFHVRNNCIEGGKYHFSLLALAPRKRA